MIFDSFNQPGYEQSSCSHYISTNSCCFLASLWFLAVVAPRRRVAGAPTSPSHINRQNNTVGSGLGGAAALAAAGYWAAGCNFIHAGWSQMWRPMFWTTKLCARTSHWPLSKPPGTVIIPVWTVLAGYCAAQTVLRLAGPWKEPDKAAVGEYKWREP